MCNICISVPSQNFSHTLDLVKFSTSYHHGYRSPVTKSWTYIREVFRD